MIDKFLFILGQVINPKDPSPDIDRIRHIESLKLAAWQEYLANGGTDLIKYTPPSHLAPTSWSAAFAQAKAAVLGEHLLDSIVIGNDEVGYTVDKDAVAKLNEDRLKIIQENEIRAAEAAEAAAIAASLAEKERKERIKATKAKEKQKRELEASIACESPAETDFLLAIIEKYSMKFSRGAFRGDGIKVRKQVEIDCFRVDFLFNDDLIVEIDGHEFHSGKENADRDARRDSILRAKGYKMLRIPAYRVFHNPEIAACDVDDFLKSHRPKR